jgi:hypothetical protein
MRKIALIACLALALPLASVSGRHTLTTPVHASGQPAPKSLSWNDFFGLKSLDGGTIDGSIANVKYPRSAVVFDVATAEKDAASADFNTHSVPQYNALAFDVGVDDASSNDEKADFHILLDGAPYWVIHLRAESIGQHVVVPFGGHTLIKFVIDQLAGQGRVDVGNPTAHAK